MSYFFSEGRPKWQHLQKIDGYIPVYIRIGDTPLEEINPDLAEAFHAQPSGRNAGKVLDAVPDIPEQDQTDSENIPEVSSSGIDRRPYEKKLLEKKKKVNFEISNPVERR